jgi:ATP/maltotriose-dependent transcriptional regulator MalT
VGTHDTEQAMALADEAIGLASEQRDDAVLALALIAKGDHATDPDTTREATLRAAELAERLRGATVRHAGTSSASLLGEAANLLAGAVLYRDLPEALAWQRRAVEVAERGGDRRLLAGHLALCAWMNLLGGHVEAAGQLSARACSLISDSVHARWEDNVALSHALVLFYRGETELAEAEFRDVVRTGLSAGRLLHVHYAFCSLVDLLLAQDRLADADDVLTRAGELLAGSDDTWFLTRVRARRARLLRMRGRPDEAAAVLKETEQGIDPADLTPEHMIWLLEHALIAGSPAERQEWIERLLTLSERTGVWVPPWERRWLDDNTR